MQLSDGVFPNYQIVFSSLFEIVIGFPYFVPILKTAIGFNELIDKL